MTPTPEDVTIKLLKKHFYLNFFILFTLFLLVLFDVLVPETPIFSINTMMEMYIILFIIISIPLILKGFSDKIKKLPKETDNVSAINTYKKASYIRLYFMSFITLASCTLYALSDNKNFMYITVILLIVFLLIRPSYPELISITEKETKDVNSIIEVEETIKSTEQNKSSHNEND
jgi:hypothetical protein